MKNVNPVIPNLNRVMIIFMIFLVINPLLSRSFCSKFENQKSSILFSQIEENNPFGKDIKIISAKGTGHTVGNVATFILYNSGSTTLSINIGKPTAANGSLINPFQTGLNGMFFIPSSKKYQGYVITGPGNIDLPPGVNVVVNVEGVCIDPTRPPIPDGADLPTPNTWIFGSEINPNDVPLTGIRNKKIRSINTVVGNLDIIPGINQPNGTKSIITPESNSVLFAFLVMDAVSKIDSTVHQMDKDGYYYTGVFENEMQNSIQVLSLITTWVYVGTLTGEDYTKKDFITGFENETNYTSTHITKGEIETLSTEIWDLVQITGVNAKVLSSTQVDRTTSSRPFREPDLVGIPEGCDTIRQKASAWLDLTAEMICNDASALADAIKDKFNNYASALNDLAGLKGKKDAAEAFKNQLTDMQNSALQGLQNEIDALENLDSDDPDCGGDWQSQMISRYGSGSQTQSRIRSTQRSFESLKRSKVRRLSERMDRQATYWNKKQETIDNQITDIQNEIDGKQKEVDDLNAELNALFDALLKMACDFKIQWDELLNFMEANYKCLDCPQVCMELPPIIINLNDCLSDLLRKLNSLRGDIPVPNDEDLAKAAANAQFDPKAAKALFDAVQKAIDNYQNHIKNGAGNSVTAVPLECKRLLQRSSGYQFFGGVNRAQTWGSDRGNSYGTPGSGSVSGPANPSSLNSRQARNEYRRDREKFNSDASRLAREINRAVNSAKRGYNGKPVEDGFTDPENIDAHGKSEAIKFQQENQQKLNELLDDFNKKLLDCYNNNIQKQQQTRYVELITKCLIFKQCGLALATTYGDYKRLIDSLINANDNRIARLEGDISNLESHLESLERQISQHQNAVKNLQSQIEGLNSGLGSGTSEAANALKASLQSRLQELNKLIQDLNKKRQAISNALNASKQMLDGAKQRSDTLNDSSPIRAVRDIKDCDSELKRIENLVNRANDVQNGPISDGLDNAEAEADNAKDDLDSGFEDSGDISEGIRELDADATTARDELEDIDRAIKEAQALKRRLNCERILAEYYNKNKPSNEVEIDIESIQEEIENVQELLDQIDELREKLAGENEKLVELMESLKDKAGKAGKAVEEIKRIMDLSERLSTLWKGLNTDDPEDRAKAFGEILRIANELAERVPGFGDMISYYAQAYEASFNAILAIRDRMINTYMADANKFINARNCENLINKADDKSLDDIAEELWDEFLNSIGENGVGESILRAGLRGSSNYSKFKEMFKANAISRIIECCIFR